MPCEILSEQTPPLPSRMPDGRLVTFGVELEGYLGASPFLPSPLPESPAGQRRFLEKSLKKNVPNERFFVSEICNPQAWQIDADRSIKSDDPGRSGIEIKTPILSGESGLKRIQRTYAFLDKLGFETNKTCGIHIHVSLGWDPAFLSLPDDEPIPAVWKKTYGEIANIYDAYWKNRAFLNTCVKAHRLKNAFCHHPPSPPKDPSQKRETPLYFSALHAKNMVLTAEPLADKGTIEWRQKEADHYVAVINYIRFMVTFTICAALDPNIDAHVLKHELDFRASRGETRPRRRQLPASVALQP